MMNSVDKAGLLSIFFAGTVLVAGCAEGGDDYSDIEARNAEIVDNLIEAGFSEDDIEIRESETISDDFVLEEPEAQVFVDGDILMTLEASRELLDDEDGEAFRHWRTPGLVTNNRTICLARVTNAAAAFASYRLTDAMRTGVGRARTNFNNLSSFGLNFKVGNASLNAAGQLSTGMTGCNFVIYVYQVNGGAGGSAGFPSGGAPFNQVRLNSGLAGSSLDVHEHVATHEIGHAIGLRHSDWKTRSSCGQNTNEGRSGASRIPGTPDQTTNSIMASCFGFGTNGEFKGQDQLALQTIY